VKFVEKRADKRARESAEAQLLKKLKSCVSDGDFKQALDIIEQIDVNRIKVAPNLCLIGEVYMHERMYDEAENVFVRAYDKTPSNRRILNLLTSLYIEMGDYGEAEYYYKEFIGVASRDLHRYILRYRLDKAKGERSAVLIDTLEKLKDYEYIEEWAYELAELYHRSGDDKKAVHECDEIVLWFGHGEYVNKAVKLKCEITGEAVPVVDEDFMAAYDGSQTDSGIHTPTGFTDASIDIDLIEQALKAQEDKQAKFRERQEKYYSSENVTGKKTTENNAAEKNMTEKNEAAADVPDDESQSEYQETQAVEGRASFSGDEDDDELWQAPDGQEASLEMNLDDDDDEDDGHFSDDDKDFLNALTGEDEENDMADWSEKHAVSPEKASVFDALSTDSTMDFWGRNKRKSRRLFKKRSVDEIARDEIEKAAEKDLNRTDVKDADGDMARTDIKDTAGGTGNPDSEKVMNKEDFLNKIAAYGRFVEDDLEDREYTEEDMKEENPEENLKEYLKEENLEDEDLEDDFEDEVITENDFAENITEDEFSDESIPEDDSDEDEFSDESMSEDNSDEDEFSDESMSEDDSDEDEFSDESMSEDDFDEDDFSEETFGEDDFFNEIMKEDGASGNLTEVSLDDDDLDAGDSDDSFEDDFEDDFEDEVIGEHNTTVSPEEDADLIMDDDDVVEERIWTEEDKTFINGLFDESKTSRDVFGTLPDVGSVREQLNMTFTKIEANQSSDYDILADYDINFVVLADDKSVKSQISLGIAKALNTYGLCDKDKIVRTKAADLNQRDFSKIFAKLAGGCLIIEKADLLSDESAKIIEDYVNQENQQTAIVFASIPDEMKKFWKKHQALRAKFLNVINVGKYNEMELVTLAKGYIEQRKYELDPEAALVLRDYFRGCLESNQSVNYEDVMGIVDMAVSNLEKRNMRNLFMTVLDNKYEEAKMFRLIPEDFKMLEDIK